MSDNTIASAILNYSAAARQQLAREGKQLVARSPSSNRPSNNVANVLTPLLARSPQPATAPSNNPYEQYHLPIGRINSKWADGHFVLDLDKFITVNRVNTGVNYYNIAFVGSFGDGEQSWISRARPAPKAQIADKLRHKWGSRIVSRDIVDAQHFTFLLGDMLPPAGATSPYDSRLEEFSEFYCFNSAPCFGTLGNREYNLHEDQTAAWMLDWVTGHGRCTKLYRAMSVVMYSYREDVRSNIHTPNRFYCLSSEKIETHFIVLDSSTFAFDREQQKWLLNLYEMLTETFPDHRIILIMHHALQSSSQPLPGLEWVKYVQEDFMTRDKTDQDTGKLHRTPQTYKREQGGGPSAQSLIHTMGGFVKLFLERYQIKIEAVFCANEHWLAAEPVSMQYADGERATIKQFTSGGAGATPFSSQLSGSNAEVVRDYGYLVASFNKESCSVQVCNTSGGGVAGNLDPNAPASTWNKKYSARPTTAGSARSMAPASLVPGGGLGATSLAVSNALGRTTPSPVGGASAVNLAPPTTSDRPLRPQNPRPLQFEEDGDQSDHT